MHAGPSIHKGEHLQAHIDRPPIPRFIRKGAALAADRARIQQVKDTRETYRARAERRIRTATDDILREEARAAERELQGHGHLIDEGGISYAATPTRVYERKETGYYQAAKACADYMANRPHALLLPTTKLLDAMLPHVESAVALSTPLPRKQFFYGAMALPVQKYVRRLLEAQRYVLPRRRHRTLKELRDFLRDNQPAGRETGNSAYQFFNGTHVRIQQGGRLLTIRDKRGIPCVRIKGTDKNLYTLLAGDGIDQETADAWMNNSRPVASEKVNRPCSNWQLSAAEIDSIGMHAMSVHTLAA
jgi:hypothetical protein